MTPVPEIKFGLLPDSLPQPRDPRLRPLERVAIAIKLVCAKGLVAHTQQDRRIAQNCTEPCARKCCAVPVFSVGPKPRREVAPKRQLLAYLTSQKRDTKALRVYAEVSDLSAEANFRGPW